MEDKMKRFVHQGDYEVEELPWGPHDWLCKPGFTDAKNLLLVRVTMPHGKGHNFHVHPEMEEIIFVISGKAEQWVDKTMEIIGPGELAHIPKGEVHATFNAGEDDLVFLAILSPASAENEVLVDVSTEEPWSSLRES